MKQLLRIGLSIGISFAILALLLQLLTSGLPDQQRPSVFSALKETSLELVFAYFVLYLIALLIRAVRYRLLLRISGEENVPTFKQMAMVTGIRNMVVDMLPARLGELGYVGLLNRGYGVKLQHCVSSLGICIAFDLVALFVIALLIVASQVAGSGVEGWALTGLVSALVLAVIAMFGLFVLIPTSINYLKNQMVAGADGWKAKSLGLLESFSDSLVSVREAGKTGQIIALSVVIRLLKYWGMYLLFIAVAGPSFESLAQLSPEKIVSALIGGEIGASLPLPTFMSFGAYEAGGALVFQLLGVVDTAAATVTILCSHIWSQLMEYILGGALLALFILINRQGVKASNMSGVTNGTQVTRSCWMKWGAYALASSVLLAGSFFLAWQLRATTKLGALTAPAAGQVSEDDVEWQLLSKQHVSNLDGFVVFSSNRDGNHDIFKLNLSDFNLTKLTTHPHTETYPRISPDGSKLVFSRAHLPWVSLRNTVAWDVYVLNLESMKETKIASNSTSPHWISNDQITYLQDATKVVTTKLTTLKTQTLFETGEGNKMPKGAHISNPKYNPITEQLVFTGRQSQIGMYTGHWGTAIADTKNNQHKGVQNGCELSWNSAGDGLYQVTHGGRANDIQIVSVDTQTFKIDTLIDLDGEFSHEYWPKDSSNGQYMVFGASRSPKEHEHDTQDYEIFLWKVGSDKNKATRLTFHTGNDSWPDVFIE